MNWVHMNLNRDDHLVDEIKARLPELLEKLDIGQSLFEKTLIICFIDEGDDTRCRFIVSTRFDYSYTDRTGRLSTTGRIVSAGEPIESVTEELYSWYDGYDWSALGLERYEA